MYFECHILRGSSHESTLISNPGFQVPDSWLSPSINGLRLCWSTTNLNGYPASNLQVTVVVTVVTMVVAMVVSMAVTIVTMVVTMVVTTCCNYDHHNYGDYGYHLSGVTLTCCVGHGILNQEVQRSPQGHCHDGTILPCKKNGFDLFIAIRHLRQRIKTTGIYIV